MSTRGPASSGDHFATVGTMACQASIAGGHMMPSQQPHAKPTPIASRFITR